MRMRRRNLRIQRLTQFRAPLPQNGREAVHHPRKGVRLLPGDHGIALQNIVPASQSPFIAAQSMQVVRKHLTGREVQKTPPMLRAAAQQIHVAMIHPHHQTGRREVIRRLPTRHAIQRETSRRRTLRIAQPFSAPNRLHEASRGLKAHQLAPIRRPRRLQPHQHTRRLDE